MKNFATGERASTSRPPRVLAPEHCGKDLIALVGEAAVQIREGSFDPMALEGLLRRYPREGRGFFSRAELIAGFRRLLEAPDGSRGSDAACEIGDHAFVASIRRRPVRTQSGVTPLTLLTKPFPCPGKCVFCPNDVRMPKSYLTDEPGAQRATANRFDPYLQTWNRLAAYRAIGHPTDKVELIVLGGTWSFYPEAYQIWFAMRCFEALNDFGAGRDARAEIEPSAPDFDALPRRIDGRAEHSNPYNRVVTRFLSERLGGELVPPGETAAWSELERAQRENEGAACRSVGFVLETRPDYVTPEEVLRIRKLGGTKVQIGIQSLDDAVLSANQRGHDVAATRRAVGLLRSAGFKVHAHWMPNLLGATPESDAVDFVRLFADEKIRPDELKIYPCSLIESAELMKFHERGEWRPYTHDELLVLLAGALQKVPRYCRVTRVIRDISSDDIVTGNKRTNFRQLAEAEVVRRGGMCQDVRSREIRREGFDPDSLVLRVTAYGGGRTNEQFLEYVTPEDRIVAFLRLSFPSPELLAVPITEELRDRALVREVHVYGESLALGQATGARPQHRGLGTKLVREAARRARAAGYGGLAVISAVGTRGWYRRLSFEDGALYQHLRL